MTTAFDATGPMPEWYLGAQASKGASGRRRTGMILLAVFTVLVLVGVVFGLEALAANSAAANVGCGGA